MNFNNVEIHSIKYNKSKTLAAIAYHLVIRLLICHGHVKTSKKKFIFNQRPSWPVPQNSSSLVTLSR